MIRFIYVFFIAYTQNISFDICLWLPFYLHKQQSTKRKSLTQNYVSGQIYEVWIMFKLKISHKHMPYSILGYSHIVCSTNVRYMLSRAYTRNSYTNRSCRFSSRHTLYSIYIWLFFCIFSFICTLFVRCSPPTIFIFFFSSSS